MASVGALSGVFEHGARALLAAWVAVGQHLLESAVFIGGIALLSLCLGNAPSTLRHRLWSLALLKLFLPVSLLGSLVATLPVLAWEQLPAAWTQVLRLEPLPVVALAPERLASPVVALLWAATLLWAIGAGRILFTARRRSPEPLPADALSPAAAGRLGLARERLDIDPERIVVTSESIVPCVMGTLRPRIYLPRQVLEELVADELVAVLAHEWAHARRRDPARLLLLHVAGALFFFFPPLWLLRARLHASAEMACDEAAVAAGVHPPVLAGAIARTLRLGLGSPSPVVGLGSTRRSLLIERLERLSRHRRYPSMVHHRAILATAAVALAALTLAPRAGDGVSAAGDPEQKTASSVEKTANSAQQAGGSAEESANAAEKSADAGEKEASFDTPPQPIETVPAVYPKECREQGIGGRVLLQVVISERGDVATTEVVESVAECPALADAAVAAVAKWKFEPATLNGKPVEVVVQIPFQFTLD